MSSEDGSWTIWICFSSVVTYIFGISDLRYTLKMEKFQIKLLQKGIKIITAFSSGSV